MLPLISFETGRKSLTQSSGQDHSLVCASKWKSGSYPDKEPRLRGRHTWRSIRKDLHPRSSRSASGELFSLLTKTYHGSPVIRRAEGYKRAIAESGLNLVSDYLIAEPKGDVETKRHGAEAMPKS